MTQREPWEVQSHRQIIDTPFLKVRSEQVKLPDGTFTSLLDGKNVEGQVEVRALDAIVLLSH